MGTIYISEIGTGMWGWLRVMGDWGKESREIGRSMGVGCKERREIGRNMGVGQGESKGDSYNHKIIFHNLSMKNIYIFYNIYIIFYINNKVYIEYKMINYYTLILLIQ